MVSIPHKVDNATYQESYAAFAASAKEAAAFGAAMNYGSQPIIPHSVRASMDTPLNLTYDNQDCECLPSLSFSILQIPPNKKKTDCGATLRGSCNNGMDFCT